LDRKAPAVGALHRDVLAHKANSITAPNPGVDQRI
jgi:hypothetical protein